MRSRVLVVVENEKEIGKLESGLQSVAENGGVVFLVKERSGGLDILDRARPQLVFIEDRLQGEQKDIWSQYGADVVVVDKHTSENVVLEKCRGLLLEGSSDPIPPM